MRNILVFAGIASLTAIAVVAGQGSQAANESLWEAARAGDTARITAALGQGADVNAKSRYDVTALIFAAGNGRLEAVKLLVSRGADVNAQDTLLPRDARPTWRSPTATPTSRSYLLQNGADADGILRWACSRTTRRWSRRRVAGKVTRQGLQSALSHGRRR